MLCDPEPIDFYLGRPLDSAPPPQFLGVSVLVDTPAGAVPSLLTVADQLTTADDFTAWCRRHCTPGWPWPWQDSTESPWAACFASRSLYVYRYGNLALVAHLSRWTALPDDKPAPFPRMTEDPR